MYAAHFGLSHRPFSIAPDPRYLFMSERHREALAHLLYGIESGGGFVLLTGEIGAGKTTICRRFLEQIPKNARVAYIFNPKLTVGDLLKAICHEFHIQVKHEGIGPATIKDHLDPLNDYLLSSHAAGLHNILIIDEAQGLTSHVLEQLRLLTNLETNERKLLQIILIGQPELRDMLARPELEQLAQRVIAQFHLGALSARETRQYVSHRMIVAGWKGPLPFSDKALRQVHRLTGGVPRRINLLCDRALLGTYANGQTSIDHHVIDQAATEVFASKTAKAAKSAASWWGKPQWASLAIAAGTGALLVWATTTLLKPSAPRTVQPDTVAPNASERAPTTVAPAKAQPPIPREAVLADPPKADTPALAALPPGPPPSERWLENENEGFAALGALWGEEIDNQNPCARTQEQGLQCYRTSRMTVNGLRMLDRPALLKLQVSGQRPGYVLATAISDVAIELSVGEQRWRTPLSALSSVWNGNYASLWRTPPGQKGRVSNGYDAGTARWMEAQLTSLQQQGKLPAEAQTLKQKVEAFQRANGLDVNGAAGTTTLILINRATSVEEPRLALLGP
jgi:general secretion pathway protein A